MLAKALKDFLPEVVVEKTSSKDGLVIGFNDQSLTVAEYMRLFDSTSKVKLIPEGVAAALAITVNVTAHIDDELGSV